jgi:MFS transporter, PPP family, 3-phenylpropionic acid transporter
LTFFGAAGAQFPYMPVYLSELGIHLAAIGLIFAAAAAVQFAAAPLWGAATDYLGSYRAAIVVASIVAAGAAAVLANVQELAWVAGAYLCLAGAQVGVSALLNARTLQLLGTARTRYGRYRLWGSVGFVAVSLGVGVLVDRAGMGALFWIYIPLLLGVGVVMAGLRSVRREPRVSVRRGAAQIGRDAVMGEFLVGSVLEWGAVVAVNTYLSIDLVTLGASTSQVGLAWAISAAVQVPVMWFYPRLADRFGLTALITAGGLIYALRPLGYVLFANAGALVALTSLEGLGYALFICGGVAFVSTRAPRGLGATAQGIFSGVTAGLAAVLGSSIGGLIAGSFSIDTMFVGAGVVGMAGTVLITRAARSGQSGVNVGPIGSTA